MSKLTGTHSEVAAYEFTTLTTGMMGVYCSPLLLGLTYDLLVPGTVKVHGAPIQILDLRMWFFRQTDPQAPLTRYPYKPVSSKEPLMVEAVVDRSLPVRRGL